MPKARHSAEQRAEALRLYREQGLSQAARQTGIAQGTIASWAHRKGVQSLAPQTMAAAQEMARLTREQRAAEIEDDLWEIAGMRAKRLRDNDGVKVSDKDRATIMGIAIDKAQLLGGKPTSRIETLPPEAVEEYGKLIELKRAG